jgi:hypothetical protein
MLSRNRSGTHVFLGCTYPKLESPRKAIWDRLDEDGKMRNGQLLGKSKWEKPLIDWIIATGVGLVGHEMRDKACWINGHRLWQRLFSLLNTFLFLNPFFGFFFFFFFFLTSGASSPEWVKPSVFFFCTLST